MLFVLLRDPPAASPPGKGNGKINMNSSAMINMQRAGPDEEREKERRGGKETRDREMDRWV